MYNLCNNIALYAKCGNNLQKTYPFPIYPLSMDPVSQSTEPKKCQQYRKAAGSFINLNAHASGEKNGLSARSQASKLYIDKLTLTESQKVQINELYAINQVEDTTYTKDDNSQIGAAIALGTRHLDLDARESVGSRWSIKWSRSTGKKGKVTQRTLYQWCVSLLSILSAVYSDSIYPVTAAITMQ